MSEQFGETLFNFSEDVQKMKKDMDFEARLSSLENRFDS